MPEPGTFMWNQLVTDDQATAGAFYSELFGWKRNEIDAGPLGTYTVFQHGGEDVAGMMNPTAPGPTGILRRPGGPPTSRRDVLDAVGEKGKYRLEVGAVEGVFSAGEGIGEEPPAQL